MSLREEIIMDVLGGLLMMVPCVLILSMVLMIESVIMVVGFWIMALIVIGLCVWITACNILEDINQHRFEENEGE